VAKPTTVDQLTAGLHGQPYKFWKLSITAKGAGTYADLFQAGGIPGAGSAPAIAGAQCDRLTVGALQIPATTPGKETWLTALTGVCSNIGSLTLYDRLVHWGGLNGTLTTAQALGAVALPRHTDGVGVYPYLVYFAAGGATATTATISYTNQSGVAGRTASVSTPATATQGQVVPFPLQAGDQGCLSVQSVTLAATSGSPSNLGIFLAVEKAVIGGLAVENKDKDWLNLGMPKIQDGACLGLMELCSTTSTGLINYLLSLSDV
jgi:hypothetical protein